MADKQTNINDKPTVGKKRGRRPSNKINAEEQHVLEDEKVDDHEGDLDDLGEDDSSKGVGGRSNVTSNSMQVESGESDIRIINSNTLSSASNYRSTTGSLSIPVGASSFSLSRSPQISADRDAASLSLTSTQNTPKKIRLSTNFAASPVKGNLAMATRTSNDPWKSKLYPSFARILQEAKNTHSVVWGHVLNVIITGIVSEKITYHCCALPSAYSSGSSSGSDNDNFVGNAIDVSH